MRLPVPPPGALPQEKADNVSAKLSQGEYVLPAEVVRFYGLEKIEGMVNKAKEGLQNMQQDGRIKEAPTDRQRAQGQATPQSPQQPPMQPQGPMQQQAPVAANMGQPAPGFNQGGLVRTTLPDGRTIFLPPGVQTPTLGHNVMGGSAMQTVAKEQEEKKKEEAVNAAENPVGEGLHPGGESDTGTGAPGNRGTNTVDQNSFDSVADWGKAVETQMTDIAKDFSTDLSKAKAQFSKDLDQLGRAFGGSSAAEDAGYGGGNPGDGSGGVSSSDTEDGVDDGVGSGVEGGMGTTGGHDDGGEESDSSGMGEGGGAAAGGGPAGEAGNDADGDGSSDSGLKDGGFLAPPAVKKYKRKKKR